MATENFDYSEFDKQFNAQEIVKKIYEAETGSGNYEKVPYGIYEVKVSKCELKKTKATGDPMVSISFKILKGEYENRLIFMNQVVTQGFQFHIVNEFLRSLDTCIGIHFDSYKQYGDMLLDIAEQTEKEHLEYALEYSETVAKNGKTYDSFQINEVFESSEG